MFVEWLLVVLPLAGAGLLAFRHRASSGARRFFPLLVLGGLLPVWLWQQHLKKKMDSLAQLTVPHIGRATEYAGSDSCRACHPGSYASWHRSFHRTMTQIASADSVRGEFDDVSLELDGEVYRLEHRGDAFWVEMTDPDWIVRQPSAAGTGSSQHPDATPPRVRRRISLVTGSHHMQAYWVDNQHGNQQFSLPFTYLFEQKRWVPRRSVFLLDPKSTAWKQIWNVGCIDCHSTAGQPRQTGNPASFDTRVAEFGIACEACHGPGAEHVRLNSDPARRYRLHFEGRGDESIVNPARLSSRRASEICGRCHSVHVSRDEERWIREGSAYEPGDDLETKIRVIRRPESFEARRASFWSDGMIRVSGREYNGLIRSPCFLHGNLSCLSCHSMHDSSPVNQLAKDMEGNAACLQCHRSLESQVEQHTHHAANSSGSLCYNCHMPYTTYGLVKALRSHEISSPSVRANLQTGRPNACNLCHLDKTLDWTARNLASWRKTPQDDLSFEDKTVAASVLWALKGDAGQRALAAWHMGWKPAREISGESRLAPWLAVLLEDPYASVRYIAGRSLQRLPGYEHFSYDYLAAPNVLHNSRKRAMELWTKPATEAALLAGKNGELDEAAVDALLQSRNNRLVELNE